MYRSFKRIMGGALAGVSALALTIPVAPAAFADGPNSGDPGVARISTVSGGVDVHRTDVNGDYAAALNAPVTVGDYIETQNGGRTEIEFDHATVLRIAPQTQLRFTHLTPDSHELQLAQGTVELRLFHDVGGHPVVETPSADVRPDENGRYRITVDGAGNTIVTVRSGHVDVSTQGGFAAQTLGPGQTVEIAGAGRSAQFRPTNAVAYDSFDGWCDARDGGWSHVQNWTYVDAGMVGENDLSDYGQWQSDPQYGQVWTPTDVASDWSPYSDGRYVWEADFGWTWVGAEPWGYAPYHYGRWFYASDRWCWTPGAYDDGNDYYAYQPAVVGFFALGAGIGIGFSIGDVGWVPLAPGEAYHPWWGTNGSGFNASARYENLGYAGGYYRNARYGAVAVSGRDFADGNFRHARRFDQKQVGRATAFSGVVPIVPTSRNLAFGPRQTGRIRTVASSRNFSRMTAPRVTRVAFATQRNTVASLGRKQHPAYASSIARQVKAPNRGAGFTSVVARNEATTNRTNDHRAIGAAAIGGAAVGAAAMAHYRATHSNVASHAARPSVWNRFGGKTANQTTPNRTTTGLARNAYAKNRAAYTAPRTATTHTYVAPHAATHTYVAPHAATHTYVAPHAATHTYAAPHAATHTYVAPHAATRTYVAPHAATHTYAAPRTYTTTHSYTAPHATYHAPVAPKTYVAPHYTAPRTYTAPHYTAPVTQHVAPVTHVAPHPGPPAHPNPPHGDDHHR